MKCRRRYGARIYRLSKPPLARKQRRSARRRAPPGGLGNRGVVLVVQDGIYGSWDARIRHLLIRLPLDKCVRPRVVCCYE